MKIGIMCHSGCGGSARIAIDEAAELARRGHRVHLFNRNSPFMAPDKLPDVIVHTLFGKLPKSRTCLLEVDWPRSEIESMTATILQVISDEGMDILHVHYALPFAFIAAEIRRRLDRGAPALVTTLHGSDVSVYGRNQVLGPALAQALKSSNALTTVSFSHARLATRVLGLKTPKVIPNFVDLNRFPPKNRSTKEQKPIILHVSNFRPIKDVSGVLRIFAEVRKKIEAELWLVGDGEEMSKIKRMSDQYGLLREIHFWGVQRDVASILQKSDLLLMPSRSESFCLTALEAMASGVPVIASRIGGLPEVVKHGETGFLFPLGNDATAARYALSILSDAVLYQSMSLAARKHALMFDQKRVVSIYENLYDRILLQDVSPFKHVIETV